MCECLATTNHHGSRISEVESPESKAISCPCSTSSRECHNGYSSTAACARCTKEEAAWKESRTWWSRSSDRNVCECAQGMQHCSPQYSYPLPNYVQVGPMLPKSILKPAVPLTPPKVIPSFTELQSKRSTSKPRSPTRTEELLIDFSTPGPGRSQSDVAMTGSENVDDPFSPTHRPASSEVLEQSEGQDEASRKRKADKQAILEQRAARRKSMANRRVSFAPEATLHTWSVMEMAEDSTTSSASNSTRRQSSMTTQQSPGTRLSPEKPNATDRLEIPSEQIAEPQVLASPAHQRDLHQKTRRRQSSTEPETQL